MITSIKPSHPFLYPGQIAPALVLFSLMLVALPMGAFGQKTDIVILRSGDKITGEIKGLSRGRLDYNTDDMNRLSIDWAKVARISSKDLFEVELSSSLDYVGRIEHGESDRYMVIVTSGKNVPVNMRDVVRITPLGTSFWNQLDGSVDLGFDFARANNQMLWNFLTKVSYRSHFWGATFDASSYLNLQDSLASTTRNKASQSIRRFLARAWSATVSAQFEQNDELNLDRRLSLTLAGARYFVQTNRSIIEGRLGFAGTTETFVMEDRTENLEGVVSVGVSFFQFTDPEVDFTLSGTAFPSISDLGRVRGNVDVALKWELIKDFNVGLNGFLVADSRPAGDAKHTDYGISTTLGYSF